MDLDIELSRGVVQRLRFIGIRHEAEVQSRLEKRRYRTEYEAKRDFERISEDPDSPFKATCRFVRRREEKRRTQGAPKQNYNPPKEYDEWWAVDIAFSSEKALSIARRDSTKVLVTNLPQSNSDRESYRDGVTNEGVLKLYNQEYKVEHSFRLMKSGIGLNSIHLQTSSRENAMMFVVCIAVLISNIADAVFRRTDARLDGKQLTMYRLAHELQTFSRSETSWS